MSDVLFTAVETFNAQRPWGRFLDSGTGVHSQKWIQKLDTSGWTAITADQQMKSQIVADRDINLRASDKLVVGNWMDANFCKELGTFDTILADYLIGAVDGFSPYQQDIIVSKLAQHLNPDGRLYVIGMNPIPDYATPPADIVTEVRRARDSCIMLAGHRPYREFPLDWMTRHLERANFEVSNSKSFTILHSEESILRQLRVGQSKLPLFSNPKLREGMEVYINELGERVKTAARSTATGRIPLSFDYVIAARIKDQIIPVGEVEKKEGEEIRPSSST